MSEPINLNSSSNFPQVSSEETYFNVLPNELVSWMFSRLPSNNSSVNLTCWRFLGIFTDHATCYQRMEAALKTKTSITYSELQTFREEYYKVTKEKLLLKNFSKVAPFLTELVISGDLNEEDETALESLMKEIQDSPLKDQLKSVVFNNYPLDRLPDLSSFTGLENIAISNCPLLNSPLDFSSNKNLNTLKLSNLPVFNRTIFFSNEGFFKKLHISNCPGFNSVLSLPESLTYFNLESCDRFNQCFVLPNALKEFCLENCKLFDQRITLPSESCLEQFIIKDLPLFNQPLYLHNKNSISSIFIKKCSSFNQTLSLPSSLENLEVVECAAFNQFLDLSQNSCLKKMVIESLVNFNRGIIFPYQSSLESLFIKRCYAFNQPLLFPPSLKNIQLINLRNFDQSITFPHSIKQLFINDCPLFNQPIDLTELLDLDTFCILYCSKFNQPLDFSLQSQLIKLTVRGSVFNESISFPTQTSLEFFSFATSINYTKTIDLRAQNKLTDLHLYVINENNSYLRLPPQNLRTRFNLI